MIIRRIPHAKVVIKREDGTHIATSEAAVMIVRWPKGEKQFYDTKERRSISFEIAVDSEAMAGQVGDDTWTALIDGTEEPNP